MSEIDQLGELFATHSENLLLELMEHEQYKALRFPEERVNFLIDVGAAFIVAISSTIIKKHASNKRTHEFIDFVAIKAKMCVDAIKDEQ